jgi:GR25 family glycosyltransferase involved in LPS biosynthesis
MKSFIIRLKGNHISETHALDCISQGKKYNLEIEYFDAINGLNCDIFFQNLNINAKYKFKKRRPGVAGCFLSHYFLWRQCLEDKIPYLILEHDGYFIRPLPEDILSRFTEVLKLDNLDPYSKNYDELIEIEKSNIVDITKYHNPQAKFLEKNQTGNYMRGAYSYIIKPQAARKLINWVGINGWVPADQLIGDAIVDIQVVTPTIARLHPAYSNKISELSLTGNPHLL